MANVFISYKREQRRVAEQLARILEEHSISVWWDPELRAGERFDDVIENAIRTSDCIVVLWSSLSVESLYVRDEAGLALTLGKLLPVRIDNTALPFRFQGLHTHSLTNWTTAPPGPDFALILRDITRLAPQSSRSHPSKTSSTSTSPPPAPATSQRPSTAEQTQPAALHPQPSSIEKHDPALSPDSEPVIFGEGIWGTKAERVTLPIICLVAAAALSFRQGGRVGYESSLFLGISIPGAISLWYLLNRRYCIPKWLYYLGNMGVFCLSWMYLLAFSHA